MSVLASRRVEKPMIITKNSHYEETMFNHGIPPVWNIGHFCSWYRSKDALVIESNRSDTDNVCRIPLSEEACVKTAGVDIEKKFLYATETGVFKVLPFDSDYFIGSELVCVGPFTGNVKFVNVEKDIIIKCNDTLMCFSHNDEYKLEM